MRVKDFVDQVRSTGARFSPPVRSRLDIDFYKFTMGQLIHKHFGDVEVTFKLIVRDKDIPLTSIIDEHELRQSLDYIQGLLFEKTDLYYLRGMDLYAGHLFSESYLQFLKSSRLTPYRLTMNGQQLELEFTGPWSIVTMWETMALAAVTELYYRSLMRKMPSHELEILYARAMDRLYSKLEKLHKVPRIHFADFSQRRRHSFSWQEWGIGLCKEVMGSQFTGTSNAWMAFHHNIDPIGTNAHELPMALTALANTPAEMRYAQYRVLELWQEMYGQGLRIFLPDTYGSAQFFKNAPDWLASWKGQREDSGDPIQEINRYIGWLRRHGEDPKNHLTIPSDGLDLDSMLRIDNYVEDEHPHPFGWGTLSMNDFRNCCRIPEFRPFSIVCKMVSANGRPVVKLSNNPKKATGPREEIERYQGIFGNDDRAEQDVVV